MSISGGIINVYKPVGLTSFAVVSKIRRLFHVKRVGHCGTLDPFAQGVLPICLERATSVVRYMDQYDKRYRVSILFGAQTDTQDWTGTVVYENYPDDVERAKIASDGFSALKQAVSDLIGDMSQLPPMYSAIKMNGTPLYKYARQGIEIERVKREIHIFDATLVSASTDPAFTAVIDIHCSKGTYIRTICEDIGTRLTYGAHATDLVRTSCGPFSMEESITLEELEYLLEGVEDPWSLFEHTTGFFKADYAVATMPKLNFDEKDALRLIQGQVVTRKDDLPEGDKFTAYVGPDIWLGVIKKIRVPCPDTGEDTICVKAERIFVDADKFKK